MVCCPMKKRTVRKILHEERDVIMSIEKFEMEGRLVRTKVPIPFVEAAHYMPKRVFVDGCFPAGTILKVGKPVCSKRVNAMREEVNDYCHAIALTYSERFNGNPESPEDADIVCHIDLSSFFLLVEPVEVD